ncbi:MAG TPA: PilZ domain-containing protein [Tepidisphaeraceae bacterium]|nr:PilZ domain-containing protein [Tepidisphaeraceae bacterium]
MKSGPKDNRREPRMHPANEAVIWRPVGDARLISSRLLDLSQGGLALLAEAGFCASIKAGDEIAVRYMRRDNGPTHYAVVWLRQIGDAIALGCRRLSGISAAAGRRTRPYGLLLARLRRRLLKRGEEVTREDAVLLEHSRPLAA